MAIESPLYQFALFDEPAPVTDLAAEKKKRRKQRIGAKAAADAPMVCSFGGGVQSMAMLVLAAQGKLPIKTFLWANVGEDSENPETLRYLEAVAKPYAAAHGLEIIEVRRLKADGTPDTVYSHLMNPRSRSIGLPVRMAPDAAPGRRSCTGDFKVKPVAKWMKAAGASKAKPWKLALGISIDEFQRMRNDSGFAHVALMYPLIDLRLSRRDCIHIIEQEGLPPPPKSRCFFCCFQTLKQWQQLRWKQPPLFWKSAGMETFVNVRRAKLGLDDVFFSRALKPLAKATSEDEQLELIEAPEEEHSCGAFTCSIA